MSPKPQGLSPKAGAGALAAIALALAALVRPWEGRELVPYRDIVGVWTVCEGVTGEAVVPNKVYTNPECDRLTADALGQHYRGVMACITKPIAVHEAAAITSWAYNVGVGAACKSTLVRKVNAGLPGSIWCPELLKWNKAGGREVRGLTNRRKAELEVCLGRV